MLNIFFGICLTFVKKNKDKNKVMLCNLTIKFREKYFVCIVYPKYW